MQIGLTKPGAGGDGDSSSNGGSQYNREGAEGPAPTDAHVAHQLNQLAPGELDKQIGRSTRLPGPPQGRTRGFELLDNNEYATELLPATEESAHAGAEHPARASAEARILRGQNARTNVESNR